MAYTVQLEQFEPLFTGVIRCRAALAELSRVIPHGCGEVWKFMRNANLPRPGRHLAFYLDDDINLEVGVEVPEAFAGDQCVRLGAQAAHPHQPRCSRAPAKAGYWQASIGVPGAKSNAASNLRFSSSEQCHPDVGVEEASHSNSTGGGSGGCG